MEANDNDFEKEYLKFASERTFETDNEAGNETLKGMAEGKKIFDLLKKVENDYSLLLNKNSEMSFGGLDNQIRMWYLAFACESKIPHSYLIIQSPKTHLTIFI